MPYPEALSVAAPGCGTRIADFAFRALSLSRFGTLGRGGRRILVKRVRGKALAPPQAAAGSFARLVLAVAVVSASAGIGYMASRIWPLPSPSGAAGQVPAGGRSPNEPVQTQPAKSLPAPPTPKPEMATVVPPPSPQPSEVPISRATTASVLPAEPQAQPAAAGRLPSLALIPPSPLPPREEAAPPEPPRTSALREAGKEEVGKQETRPATVKAPNRAARPRAQQPGFAQSPQPAPKGGGLQDKAMRDFMSYPANGY